MKKSKIIVMILFVALAVTLIISSCSTTNSMITDRSGAQLWGENCIRCHNAPSPDTFSDTEWEVAVIHMRVRANLTEMEANKIADFLKSAN